MCGVMGHLLHVHKMKSTFTSDKLNGSSNLTLPVYAMEQAAAHLLAKILHDSHVHICCPLPLRIDGEIRILPQAVNEEMDTSAAKGRLSNSVRPFPRTSRGTKSILFIPIQSLGACDAEVLSA